MSNNKGINNKIHSSRMGKFRKVLSFFVIFSILFLLLQNLLTPVWNYPNSEDNLSYSYEGFFQSPSNTYDVIFLGTSHMLYGISPMEIYKEYNVCTYNLGTSGQPIDATYYTLEEVFTNQSPKVVVLDASSLFTDEEHELDSLWRFVMDSLPFGLAKLKYANRYATFFANQGEEFDLNEYTLRFASAFFPMIEYHDRFDELNENDIFDVPGVEEYYLAGYFLQTFHESSGVTVDEMNAYEKENESLANIYSHNAKVLEQIQKLCKEHECELLLTKIPAIHRGKWYTGAWTYARYEAVKSLADSLHISYYDLLYDGDISIDVERDYTDGGAHLNYLGAKKTSLFLGEYLKDTYQLEEKTYKGFEENEEGYDALTTVAFLQLIFDEKEYDEYLTHHKQFVKEETKNGFVVKDKLCDVLVDEVEQNKDGSLSHVNALFYLEDYWLAYAKEKTS